MQWGLKPQIFISESTILPMEKPGIWAETATALHSPIMWQIQTSDITNIQTKFENVICVSQKPNKRFQSTMQLKNLQLLKQPTKEIKPPVAEPYFMLIHLNYSWKAEKMRGTLLFALIYYYIFIMFRQTFASPIYSF